VHVGTLGGEDWGQPPPPPPKKIVFVQEAWPEICSKNVKKNYTAPKKILAICDT